MAKEFRSDANPALFLVHEKEGKKTVWQNEADQLAPYNYYMPWFRGGGHEGGFR